MLVKNIEKYYSKEYDLNCAEAVLYAANETYDLGLDAKALKLAAGFGGGMNINGPCGALTGAVMALGALYIKERAHEGDKIKNLEKSSSRDMRKRWGIFSATPSRKCTGPRKNDVLK